MPAVELFGPISEFSVLRVACGALFIPHIYAAFFVPQALDIFVKAGFRPPAFWMYFGAAVELVAAIGLIFGIYPSFAAILAALHLGVAAATIYRVTGGKWLWNLGGCEFPVFWAVCCLVIAVHG